MRIKGFRGFDFADSDFADSIARIRLRGFGFRGSEVADSPQYSRGFFCLKKIFGLTGRMIPERAVYTLLPGG
jgi:hypothetical protein